MKIPRATPGASDRAEPAARAWLPVEENWKLAEVLGGGGRMNPPHPPSPAHGPVTTCRRSGVRSPMLGARDVTDLTTLVMSSNKSEEELHIWTRVAITRASGAT